MFIEVLKKNPDSEGRGFIKISFNGKQQFYVEDGEPEDNNLDRGFAQCRMIPQMLQKVHELGLQGEPIEIQTIEV